MFSADITKDEQGYYLSIDKSFTDLAGIEEYHADLKWQRMTLATGMGLTKAHQESILELEHKVLRDRQPISNMVRTSSRTGWLEAVTHRVPLKGGGFRSQSFVISPYQHYQGWPNLLNHNLELLELPTGGVLTRADLIMLHLFVQGLPRKMIAKGTHCSVKSVEKRLAKVKGVLLPDGKRSHSLAQILVERQLITFLLANSDWFSLQTTFTQHVAHTSR